MTMSTSGSVEPSLVEEALAMSSVSGVPSNLTDTPLKDETKEEQNAEIPKVASDVVTATPHQVNASEVASHDAGPQAGDPVPALMDVASPIIEDLYDDLNVSYPTIDRAYLFRAVMQHRSI